MKKIIIAASALLLACPAVSSVSAAAEGTECKAYVTISSGKDKLDLIQQEVNVTDIDSDGKLTINDALYIAHENNFEGGAAAGYASSVGTYGLALDKLWGIENGGSFGYYVNNTAAMGLADEIKSGDYINAFVYSDTTAFSDAYFYFDKYTAEVEAGQELALTLSRAGYDANWNPVTLPVEGAVITVNGEATSFVTDSEGKVNVKLESAGKFNIGATSESMILVPNAVVATVSGNTASVDTSTTTTTTTTTTSATSTNTASSVSTGSNAPATGDSNPPTGDTGAGVTFAVLAAAAAVAFTVRKKNEE